MKTLSLFDEVTNEVTDEIAKTFENAYSPVRYTPGLRGSFAVQPSSVVHYTSSRTGRKTITSASRYYAAATLVSGLRKRYIGPSVVPGTTSEGRALKALNEFVEDNQKCKQYSKASTLTHQDSFVLYIRGMVRSLLADVFDRVTPSGFWARMVVGVHSGPGSSTDVDGDSGSYGRLGNSSMSFTTRAARRMYISLCECATSSLVLAAEISRQALYGEMDTLGSYATFCSVPKTNEKDRGICTQPSGNMAIQLAIHTSLVWILKVFFRINLENQQELNRELACLGSFGPSHGDSRTWTLCTLDLHSASNFPWALIVDLFPRWFVWILSIARSPFMVLPNGTRVRKYMCSTMGNGFTFALMTLLLSAIVRVLYKESNLPEWDTIRGRPVKTWGVYGDDIIVDKSVVHALTKVLTAFGFTINARKSCTSFKVGAPTFRESCGGDYMDGYDVRPVFVETLQTQADIYSILNRLVMWGVKHSIDLPRTVALLRSRIGPKEFRVPNWEDVSHGFHVPVALARPSERPHGFLKDVLDGTQSKGRVYSCLAPVPLSRSVFVERTEKAQVSLLLPWDSPLLHYEGQEAFHRSVRWERTREVRYNSRHPNMYAVLLHTLGGSIREGRYGVRRLGDTVYTEKQKYAPGWGDASLFTSRYTVYRQLSSVEAAPYLLWEQYILRMHHRTRLITDQAVAAARERYLNFVEEQGR